MKKILLFGAGKSATVLIDYLMENAQKENWRLLVVDTNLQLALDKIKDSPFASAVSFDIMNEEKRKKHIHNSDIVISMLPPVLHSEVAKDCLHFSRHLLTASYVDDDIKRMQSIIREKDILFLCEMGLDPGIDHMSAMKLIDEIHGKGGKISSFKSHCGGLVAPESDDNPWHYKISWNPKNIVQAGKAGAVFKQNNEIFNLAYESIFENNETVSVPGIGNLAFYPNRDSLSYIPVYSLEEASTFIRTTLRHPSFCKAWNLVVKGSLTDEDKSAAAIAVKHISYLEWLNKSIHLHSNAKNFQELLNICAKKEDRIMIKEMFEYVSLLSNEEIPLTATSSADVLQYILEKKLALMPEDKDMIVMLHEFEFEYGDKKSELKSSLIVKGENNLRTAMAKTVGLPLGIAAKLILNETIKLRGLHIPTIKEIYEPVLKELELYKIKFIEEVI
ncbi:MAG: saccharopine dehydrogenase C-terminal domain-containing protein [Chitinophagaceae bacterium]